MARIAMFLARSPGAPMTGRKAVIHTAIAALASEHELDLFILAKQEPQEVPRGVRRAVWLGALPKARALCNAALALLAGRRSLNEALFLSGERLRRVRALARGYDFAIADTVRAAPYAEALGVPWHLDLDDLFSTRYARYLRQPRGELAAELILGYFRGSVPSAASAIPESALRALLASESARLRRREIYWARKATTVSLVSPDEADGFSRVVGRPVFSLPMAVRVPAQRWTAAAAQGAPAVFLGGLDYKPNLDALRFYQAHVYPKVRRRCGTPSLRHIGNAPASLRRGFAPEVVHFEGYVDDVASRLAKAPLFMAPIVSGSGIKTKVLEAMAVGLPVLATREAVSGLKVEHCRHCFVCERPEDFPAGMQFLSQPGAAEAVGQNARSYVERSFTLEVLGQRWRNVMEALAAC